MVADFYSSVNLEYIYSWDGKWEMSLDYRQRQSVPLVQQHVFDFACFSSTKYFFFQKSLMITDGFYRRDKQFFFVSS